MTTPYRTARDREGSPYNCEMTGILVDAIGTDGMVGMYDIAELNKRSLNAYMRKDGGRNPVAERIVLMLLGHKTPTPPLASWNCAPVDAANTEEG